MLRPLPVGQSKCTNFSLISFDTFLSYRAQTQSCSGLRCGQSIIFLVLTHPEEKRRVELSESLPAIYSFA